MRPSRDASGTYGPSTSRSSAPITGMLTAFETSPPSSAAATCSATITPARSCASPVDAARCGVTTTLSSSSSGPEYGSSTNTSSAAPATLPERSAASSASSSSSGPRAALTIRTPGASPRTRRRRREPRVSARQRQVEGEEVRGGVHVLGRLDPLGAELAEPLRRDVRVVGDDPHPEPERAARDLLPDPAEAEHAERLAGELDTAVRAALPAALLERGVGLRDVAREGDEQADGVLGRGDDGGLRRVRHDDPAPRRRVDVDVVDAHARAPDHLQPLGALDQVGGQLRRRADDDRVVAADDLLERALAVDVHVEARAEESTPAAEISSRTRTRVTCARCSLPGTPRAPRSRRRRARRPRRDRRGRARLPRSAS